MLPDGGTQLRSMWHPFMLTICPSLMFGLVLLGAVGGLEAFVRLSDSHTGFAVPSTTLQNLATYLPIAFIIFVGWVWQAYELEVKELIPWASMCSGPVAPSDSIQLDYVGSNPLVTIATAIRKRHHGILICTLGTVAVAVCSIVAASIWDLEPAPRVLPVTLQRTGTYDGASLDSPADVSQSLTRYLARTVLQLSSPSWMTDDYVISPFNLSDATPGMVLSVYTGKVFNWTVGSNTPAILLATQLLPPNNCASAVAVGCIPSYTVADVQVAVDAGTAAFNDTPRAVGTASSVTFRGGEYLLQTIDNNNGVTGSPWDAQAQVFSNHDDPFAYIPWTTSPPNFREVGNYSPWFHLLRHILLLEPKQLMDANTIARGSQQIFSDIWRNVIQPRNVTSDSLQGTAAVADTRLISRVGSIRAIQVCLCVLAVIAIFVFAWRPHTCLPRDPSSLASIALILSESEDLARRLEGSSSATTEALGSHLRGAKYQLVVNASGDSEIAVLSDETDFVAPKASLQSGDEEACCRFDWTPPILYPVARVTLAVLVLVIIAVLELLVQLSSRHTGLVNYDGQWVQRYAWSYAGPVVLFLVGLGIEVFDAGVRAIHPFVLLHRASHPGNRLTYDPLHQSITTLPFHALRHRQPMVLVSTLAVLLLLVAKIAVAGLFTIGQVTRVTNVQVNLNTTFAWNASALADTMATNITAPFLNPDIPGYDSGNDDYELPPLELIVNAGLETPNWTTPDIAVGALAADSAFQFLPTKSNLTARLPVLYSDLVNCTAVSYVQRGNASEGTYGIIPQLECVANYGHSPSRFIYEVTLDDTGHAGAVFPIPGRTGIDVAQINCSTIFFLFARNDDINLVSCNYTMTQSTMEAKLAIDSSAAYRVLSVNRASEQHVTPVDEFSQLPLIFSGIPTQDSIVDTAYTRNNSADDAFADGAPWQLFHSGSFDYLFSAITANTSDMNTLLDKNTLITAVQSQWSQYFARLADFYMRVPTDKETSVSAALAAPQQRIFIEPKPARILEGLLAGIFVCIVSVSVTLRTAGVLPRPPYSIASRMSLLAGSEMLNLPELGEPGAQRLSTDALEKRLRGTWFKLGWWEGDTEGKGLRYGIDVDGTDHDTAVVLDRYVSVDAQSPQAEVYEMVGCGPRPEMVGIADM
ncbi:hypothetical protein EVJ58_g8802 [Rhodofomes roseus]|uniref:Transmembrane protein n=1 Tax=Rhodofomes roseus TaxID=34475 RepID=A0A4Y9XYN6_9APHY|nr:hypothetical protein EVJ58_g8802 [Rhodofomes roseus]